MAATSHGIQVVERERVEAPPAPARTDGTAATPATPVTARPVGTVPAAGIGTLGLLTLLVGAWGGIVPFVGPTFGFSGDGTMAWYWNMPHALLWLAPGAAAVVAGAVMLGMLPRALSGLGRIGAFGAGLLAVLAGAWFVIGPEAWPVLVRSAGVFTPAHPLREFARQIGYSFGPGVLLVLFGAMAMGMAGRAARPAGVARAETRRADAAEPATTGRPAATTKPATA